MIPNDEYTRLRGPMCQFWVMETARAKYLMTWSHDFNFMWGYTRPVKELPR